MHLACGLTLLFGFSLSGTSQARLHAYYVVQNVSLGGITPRILFVLDTSGSMTSRAQANPEWCDWNECEDGDGADLSRIAAARRALNEVVFDYRDQARFALMSFSRHSAPEKAAEVPDDCAGSSAGAPGNPRFAWTPGYLDNLFFNFFWGYIDYWSWYFGTNYTYDDLYDFGLFPDLETMGSTFGWWFGQYLMPFDQMGQRGTWRLCGDNRPHPYIRWDDVNGPFGAGSIVPNSPSTVDLGPAPLLNSAQRANPGNAYRRVAWFPRFMGVRVNLDHTDELDRLDLCSVRGDYGERGTNNITPCLTGSNVGTLNPEVSGHDFYYWPYVDGFPGYSGYSAVQRTTFDEIYGGLSNNKKNTAANNWSDVLGWVCNYFGEPSSCNSFNTGVLRIGGELMGVQRQPNNLINDKSELFVPFYQPGVVAGLTAGYIKYDEWYPMTNDEASDVLLGLTSRMSEGGMDVAGTTPWLQAIGETNSSAPVVANSPFSNGGTISKYIEWVRTVEPADVCSPIATVLITDGEPTDTSGSPLSSQSWKKLNGNLAGLRNDRDSKVYVVGFFIDPSSNNPAGNPAINDMACAGTGAGDTNNINPCTVAASDAHNFDTCRDPSDPENDCAFLADSPEQLALVLTQIVEGELAMDVPAGGGAAVNTFGTSGGGSEGITQTNVAARTEWPAWKGHVERELCDDQVEDPANPGTYITAPYCLQATFDEPEEAFGPCPQSRQWDAGECLEMTTWSDRRIYITDAANDTHEIYDGTTATSAFIDQLNAPELAIPGAPFDVTSATPIAEFIMGKDWKDGWKLPGLAASSPMVVRRVPEPDPQFAPSVGISDPHCAGRLLASPEEVDSDLVTFAEEAWDPALKLTSGFTSHYEYQEAVLIGDDLGLLHAFQFDSGNEMWALLPRFSLAAAVSEYAYGGEEMGQPDKLEDHVYGVSGTVNHGWVYDDNAGSWRHLAVVGMGEGGKHLIAMDVSHMSPASSDGPVEVLWTSDDAGLKSFYEPTLGETWARPALTYHIEDLGGRPDSWLVFGSGYPDAAPTSSWQGRRLVVADALTGEPEEYADLPIPTQPAYESMFAAVVDTAVGTHCVSRFWGEAQETYIADPAGRLFRWDLKEGFAHEADSGSGRWNTNSDIAMPVATFSACEASSAPCNISSGNFADPFLFPPAVVSINRIDEIPGNSGSGIGDDDQDQFLLAMVSGSPYDDTLDANDTSVDFHPSMYILVDDHRGVNKHGGFNIPTEIARVPVGSNATFMREVLTDVTRTRSFLPYPTFSPSAATPCPGSSSWNATTSRCVDTDTFSKRTRPIRAPRISVTGLNKLTGCSDLDDPTTCTGSVLETGVEVYTIEFTVFESGTNACEPGWYDPAEEIWHFDQGASYKLSYSLAVQDASGFDLMAGTSLSYLDNSGALTFLGVQQNLDGDCADGNCGPVPGVPANPPCDPNDLAPPPDVTYTIPLTTSELEGFTRVQQNTAPPPVALP